MSPSVWVLLCGGHGQPGGTAPTAVMGAHSWGTVPVRVGGPRGRSARDRNRTLEIATNRTVQVKQQFAWDVSKNIVSCNQFILMYVWKMHKGANCKLLNQNILPSRHFSHRGYSGMFRNIEGWVYFRGGQVLKFVIQSYLFKPFLDRKCLVTTA